MSIRRFLLPALLLLPCCLWAQEALPEAAGSGGAGPDMTTKMMFLALQIGIILFAAKIGGMAAVACKMPSVLGELASGILIGPYALGACSLGGLIPGGLFPNPGGEIPVTPELYGFCTIASIILLFLSGVETNFKMFLKYAFSGSVVGIGGVVVSFLFGDLCAIYILPKFLPAYEGLGILSPAALFMGIMSTATSVGITARILSERKVMDSPEGTTTMAAAVIDDVLGIIVLAIGLGVIGAQKAGGAAAGVDWGQIGRIAVKAFGIWLGATAIGLVSARYISKFLKSFKEPVAIATLAFGLSIILAGLFQKAGLSLIIGAYVMGLSLSRTDIRHLVQENLQSVYTFLVPVFFCVMGMMVDISAIASKEVLFFGLIYTVLAVLAKVLGCAVPSLFCGFNTLGSLRIGVGMIPRGEVALIIAGIGLSSGYLDNHIFSVGILMTLLTTVAPPPILVALFSTPKRGTRKADTKNADSRPMLYTLPNEETAELLLEKLVVAFRAEGFFTALLNPREGIWQISRDADEIVVSRQENVLQFECTLAEQTLIATALLDVTAELTSLAESLAKPIASGEVARQVVREGEDAVTKRKGIPMDPELARYLRSFLFLPSLAATGKNDAILEVIHKLREKGLIQDEKTAFQSIMAREGAMSTGLEHGIAIPHARTDDVQGIVGAVALCRPEGLSDYATADGSSVRILVVTLSSRTTHTPHLRLIAHVSQILGDEGRARLSAAKTEEDMRSIFLG